jgi:hypothetical protein
MEKKLTIEEIRSRPNGYKYNQYDHGGSRIYADGDSGDRQLLVDTYYDEAFAKYIDECVRKYFQITV